MLAATTTALSSNAIWAASAAAERYCVNVDTLRTAIDVEMGEA